MKRLLFFLLLTLPSFPAYTGELVVQVEKVWRIEATSPVQDMTLNGTFLALNDFQEVVQMDVSEGAHFEEVDGEVRVIYHTDNFSGSTNVTAMAIVRTAYFFTATSDPPYKERSINSSGLVAYDEPIHAAAASIASGNSKELEVVAALTDWVHDYVEYDLAYWGDSAPATEVFGTRGAVCVGYTHLFIALSRSVGFETRFVSGYAFADKWQPHAWAEVKVNGNWIPVDPTFREFGALDARHIASSYSDDQSGVFDSLIALGDSFSFNSTVTVRTQETEPFPQQVFAHTFLAGDNLEVSIYNPTDNYVTPTYTLRLPEYIHPEERKILVIPPGDSIGFNYTLDTSELDPGYSHTIPYVLSLQGLLLNEELTIIKESAQQGEGEEANGASACSSSTAALALSLVFLFLVRLRTKAK